VAMEAWRRQAKIDQAAWEKRLVFGTPVSYALKDAQGKVAATIYNIPITFNKK